MRSRVACACSIGALLLPCTLRAAEASEERQLSTREIESWLEAPSGPENVDIGPGDGAEAPPPAPRRHGFIVESGIGVLGHLGPLKHISPPSPCFHLQIGFEPLRFLMAFAETDLAFSSTSYAHRPPSTRTYRLYGFGGGVRLTAQPLEVMGAYVEASVGAARVSEDVLSVYGYPDADELHLYFGGQVGVEWYPVSPHMALALHGGLRSYAAGLNRDRSTETALAWLSGASIRYTF